MWSCGQELYALSEKMSRVAEVIQTQRLPSGCVPSVLPLTLSLAEVEEKLNRAGGLLAEPVTSLEPIWTPPCVGPREDDISSFQPADDYDTSYVEGLALNVFQMDSVTNFLCLSHLLGSP